MKKVTLMFAGAVVAAGLLAGCGSSVDENKTPEQIRQEIASWDSAKILKAVDEYTKAIAAKTEELNAALAKVKDLSPQELLGDKGRQLKAEADKIGESLKKLKDNMAAYAEGLKAKAAK